MTDASKIQYYTGYNSYKNLGVFSTSLTISGTLGAGLLGTYTTAITLTEAYKYSSAKVKTTDQVGGTARWQAFPPARFYDVPSSGPVASLSVNLSLLITGSVVTFKATAFNSAGSTLTFTSTTIQFEYAVHTTVL